VCLLLLVGVVLVLCVFSFVDLGCTVSVVYMLWCVWWDSILWGMLCFERSCCLRVYHEGFLFKVWFPGRGVRFESV